MRQFRSFAVVTLLLAFSALHAASQPASALPDKSYEIQLQVLVGSNEPAAGAQIPQNLSSLVREVRTRYAFENYRLANTYFGRIGNSGSLEYKSVTSITGQDSTGDAPSFLEWSLGSLRGSSDGPAFVQAQPFRFGARIPIRTAGAAGSAASVVNYESIGFTVNKVNFRENVPTLVGTLNLPKTSGTLFLVLTAKSVD